MLNHKEMTAHIRSLLKRDGIKARCRKFVSCGVRTIQVFSTEHGKKFSADEIHSIAHIADCNRLTGARGAKIDPKHEACLTGKELFEFEYHPT